MTNNELIWLNAGHPSITQHKSRAERYAQLCGLFAHELGHVLYTDFITSQTHLTRLRVLVPGAAPSAHQQRAARRRGIVGLFR